MRNSAKNIKDKLEFPKKYNIQSLYKMLQELSYENCLRLNRLNKKNKVSYLRGFFVKRCGTRYCQ